jgi:hypothetical protein
MVPPFYPEKVRANGAAGGQKKSTERRSIPPPHRLEEGRGRTKRRPVAGGGVATLAEKSAIARSMSPTLFVFVT